MRFFYVVLSLFFAINAIAHEAHTKKSSSNLAISVAMDKQAKLWRASVKDGFVFVDASSDMGKTFSVPVKVNAIAQKISAKGEARPKIALGPKGNIYLTWTQSLSKPFSGYIWFSRSTNNGKSFEKPKIVHHDRAEITHRFDALNVASDSKVTVAWVDKRDLVAAKKAGKKYNGAAIYYAVSNDAGESFELEQKLADSSCECCRIALTNKADGTVVALWRHVFPVNERDHAMAEINASSPIKVVRASYGHWKLDGCPHHGAALALGEGFGYHMAYFDGAGDKPSLKVSRMDGEAWVTSPPKRFGNIKHQAGHPALLSDGDNVQLVWREINAEKDTEMYGMQSTDGGRNWSSAQIIFSTKGKADYPILVKNEGQFYLAVNTVTDGFQLVTLEP